MSRTDEQIKALEKQEYPYGFEGGFKQDFGPKGLSEATIRWISNKKQEPKWLLDWRLKAYHHWRTLKEPRWSTLNYPPIAYDQLYYYASPQASEKYKSLEDVDPEVLKTFDKLGIPLREQKKVLGIAIDAVVDSVSVATTFQEELAAQGILFCALSEAIQKYPDLVKRYLGSIVPYRDNYFAALNAAVFSDGSFAYIPEGVRCPMELSTYFRINAAKTGQFERTLIIAEPGSYVSYLEGCSAPMRLEQQLHAAVVEILVKKKAEVKYATIQNWYHGNKAGKGGVLNLVTKRGVCEEAAKLSWTQLEFGSKVTWKYPSCILKGARSVGEFYSVAITRDHQQADTGTKMIHLGKGSKSRIISKGIASGQATNTYRGLVQIHSRAEGAHNFSQCDSLMLSTACNATTYPYIENRSGSATVAHEATTSAVDEKMRHYLASRGLDEEQAIALIVSGVCAEVMKQLPMEFAVEGRKLLALTVEGSVG